MTIKTLQTNFERELLFHIIFQIKKDRISNGRAQEVSKEFLKVLIREDTVEGFMESIAKLTPYYPEIREAFLTIITQYEKETVEEKLREVRKEFLKGVVN